MKIEMDIYFSQKKKFFLGGGGGGVVKFINFSTLFQIFNSINEILIKLWGLSPNVAPPNKYDQRSLAL